jgi:hypothetical protein
MALHEQSVGATSEWYTPPHVFAALGETFDLDPAYPIDRELPWIPVKNVHCVNADGLTADWFGFVWMNAPFGGRNGLDPWLDRFFAHANGIALAPDRTSAPWWQRAARKADAILFVAPKLKFIGRDGRPGKSPAQGTCLFAAGDRACAALARAQSAGLGVLAAPRIVGGQTN